MGQGNRVIVVGLTGGTGCGQTTVADIFAGLGAKVINADRIAEEIAVKDNEVRDEIRRAFGRRVFTRDGQLNRRALGELVFSDASKLNRLNQIIHPRMVERIIDELEAARESGNYQVIVIDAALIFENNLEKSFDVIVVVASQLKHRLQRLMERDKISEELLRQRIERQISIEDKLKWGDYVIHNNGTLDQLKRRAESVYRSLQKRTYRRRRSPRPRK